MIGFPWKTSTGLLPVYFRVPFTFIASPILKTVGVVTSRIKSDATTRSVIVSSFFSVDEHPAIIMNTANTNIKILLFILIISYHLSRTLTNDT
ncbi:UDP-glucose:glycoprotein glucosyltransferase [Paenibacillus amylolyticus]|uniref:UDP-glucose:glycoprotein glucosyltransferase n=1 Tax=Paenibacillus amylolyticus TaxID=1451 RepID=A0A117I296_PAEAM|nr:UDP-glucose:glycoprotein glucosyltransferase [Paenibacillus amylolyticus]